MDEVYMLVGIPGKDSMSVAQVHRVRVLMRKMLLFGIGLVAVYPWLLYADSYRGSGSEPYQRTEYVVPGLVCM
jgi:hypothetical protein